MIFDIEKLEFKAKLAGTAIDFGLIEDRKGFFDWLATNDFVEFLGRREDAHSVRQDFYVYATRKDFDYRAAWIQDPFQICEHCVGDGGRILLDLEYRSIGYKSQHQDED